MSEIVFALCVGIIAAAGLYLALARDSIAVVLGLALVGSAANLFVFAMGRLKPAQPPIVPDGALAPSVPVADPLPQALVLTAIVIGFALLCLGLALVFALRKKTSGDGADPLEPSEPRPGADGHPGYLP